MEGIKFDEKPYAPQGRGEAMGMQKQERTKKWIASAFLELADQVPPGKITVKMLCDRAGVNRSTFYYHFDSIQVLIHWIYHEEVNEPVLKLIREEKAYTEISVLALSKIYERKAFWKKVLRLKTASMKERPSGKRSCALRPQMNSRISCSGTPGKTGSS